MFPSVDPPRMLLLFVNTCVGTSALSQIVLNIDPLIASDVYD